MWKVKKTTEWEVLNDTIKRLVSCHGAIGSASDL